MSASRIQSAHEVHNNGLPWMDLPLRLTDPVVLAYLAKFDGPNRVEKAQDALKVGVLSMQQAAVSLDLHVVQDRFAAFEQELGEQFSAFLGERHGVLPKSLERFFGDTGIIASILSKHFDPTDGRLVKVIDSQVGPNSKFANALDPKNKDGVISLIEKTVQSKLDVVLTEFSLDEKDSALSRLKELVADGLADIKQALALERGRKQESARGHLKGFDFEEDLYTVIAGIGRQFGDETELVRGTPGIHKCKTGDHLIILGETSGAPGERIVVEVKDQVYKAKKAIAELELAKQNREAASGIFVFAKGCEPVEFGNFKRVDNDFYCTVEKSDLAAGAPPLFLEVAYELARVLVVSALRKDANGEVDLEEIQQHIDGVAGCMTGLGEIVTKARTVQSSGSAIESAANAIKEDIQRRVAKVSALLRVETK
jgi:hypothetical protein